MLSARRVTSGTVLGMTLGLLYTVDSKVNWSSKSKRVVNGMIGFICGTAIAFILGLDAFATIVAASIGLALGVTAKEWISHISLL